MSSLDSTPSSDELTSMESLKALVAANGASIARLCAELGVQFDAPQESTPPPTPTLEESTPPPTLTLEPRHDAVPEDDNLDIPEAFASVPLHAILEFQPPTPTRCSTQCSPADAGVVTPASDRGTSPSTTPGSSRRPLQLDGDKDSRCIEANGHSRAYVSVLDKSSDPPPAAPRTSSHQGVGQVTTATASGCPSEPQQVQSINAQQFGLHGVPRSVNVISAQVSQYAPSTLGMNSMATISAQMGALRPVSTGTNRILENLHFTKPMHPVTQFQPPVINKGSETEEFYPAKVNFTEELVSSTSFTRQLADQMTIAKAGVILAKEHSNLQLAWQLSSQIRNSTWFLRNDFKACTVEVRCIDEFSCLNAAAHFSIPVVLQPLIFHHHILVTELICWQLPWPQYMQSDSVFLIVRGVCAPWDPGISNQQLTKGILLELARLQAMLVSLVKLKPWPSRKLTLQALQLLRCCGDFTTGFAVYSASGRTKLEPINLDHYLDPICPCPLSQNGEGQQHQGNFLPLGQYSLPPTQNSTRSFFIMIVPFIFWGWSSRLWDLGTNLKQAKEQQLLLKVPKVATRQSYPQVPTFVLILTYRRGVRQLVIQLAVLGKMVLSRKNTTWEYSVLVLCRNITTREYSGPPYSFSKENAELWFQPTALVKIKIQKWLHQITSHTLSMPASSTSDILCGSRALDWDQRDKQFGSHHQYIAVLGVFSPPPIGAPPSLAPRTRLVPYTGCTLEFNNIASTLVSAANSSISSHIIRKMTAEVLSTYSDPGGSRYACWVLNKLLDVNIWKEGNPRVLALELYIQWDPGIMQNNLVVNLESLMWPSKYACPHGAEVLKFPASSNGYIVEYLYDSSETEFAAVHTSVSSTTYVHSLVNLSQSMPWDPGVGALFAMDILLVDRKFWRTKSKSCNGLASSNGLANFRELKDIFPLDKGLYAPWDPGSQTCLWMTNVWQQVRGSSLNFRNQVLSFGHILTLAVPMGRVFSENNLQISDHHYLHLKELCEHFNISADNTSSAEIHNSTFVSGMLSQTSFFKESYCWWFINYEKRLKFSSIISVQALGAVMESMISCSIPSTCWAIQYPFSPDAILARAPLNKHILHQHHGGTTTACLSRKINDSSQIPTWSSHITDWLVQMEIKCPNHLLRFSQLLANGILFLLFFRVILKAEFKEANHNDWSYTTLERRKNKWHGLLVLRSCFLYGTSQILGGRSINCIASTTESRLLFSGTTCKMGIQLLFEVLATLPSNCSAANACSSISMLWDPGVQFQALSLACVLSRPVLQKSSADSKRLWDPGGIHRQPAWGQAEIQGEGNVTTQPYMTRPWAARWAVDNQMGRGQPASI